MIKKKIFEVNFRAKVIKIGFFSNSVITLSEDTTYIAGNSITEVEKKFRDSVKDFPEGSIVEIISITEVK